jgi:hypothetical protein
MPVPGSGKSCTIYVLKIAQQATVHEALSNKSVFMSSGERRPAERFCGCVNENMTYPPTNISTPEVTDACPSMHAHMARLAANVALALKDVCTKCIQRA